MLPNLHKIQSTCYTFSLDSNPVPRSALYVCRESSDDILVDNEPSANHATDRRTTYIIVRNDDIHG